MKTWLVLLLSMPLGAFAAERTLPFAPANAADQKVITTTSLEAELTQYRYISDWHTAHGQLENNRLKLEQSNAALERAKVVHNNGFMTDVAFGQIYYNNIALKGEVIRLTNEIGKAEMGAKFHKLRVLEEGNPGADNKVEATQTIIDGLRLQTTSLRNAVEVATTAKTGSQTSLDSGRTLFAKQEISKAELERREVAAKTSANEVDSLNDQLTLLQRALTGFENNLRKASVRTSSR